MVTIHASFGKELTEYIDSIIDREVIYNRNDALRQIVLEHKAKLGRRKV